MKIDKVRISSDSESGCQLKMVMIVDSFDEALEVVNALECGVVAEIKTVLDEHSQLTLIPVPKDGEAVGIATPGKELKDLAAEMMETPGVVHETELGKVLVEKFVDESRGFRAEMVSEFPGSMAIFAVGEDEDAAIMALFDRVAVKEAKDSAEEKMAEAGVHLVEKKPRVHKDKVIPVDEKGNMIRKKRRSPKKQPKVRKKTAAPLGKNGEEAVPKELAGASSFRQVMAWMVKNVGDDKDLIVAKVEELRSEVPAIGRLSGNIDERVERALSVLALNSGS